MNRNTDTREITMTALVAALVFVATYIVRIPNPATGGYSHIGDGMIFLAVMFLGRKNGAIAAGLGAAMSDLLAGAAVWVLPTFIIKFCVAWIMGTIVHGVITNSPRLYVGAATGGIFQIVAYTLVKVLLVGSGPAIASIPNVTIQTIVGIAVFAVIYSCAGKPVQHFLAEGRSK